MNYNFEVTATIWNDDTYIERQLVPLWFDDKTKNKIREVVKEFYQGLSTKEKELYNICVDWHIESYGTISVWAPF